LVTRRRGGEEEERHRERIRSREEEREKEKKERDRCGRESEKYNRNDTGTFRVARVLHLRGQKRGNDRHVRRSDELVVE